MGALLLSIVTAALALIIPPYDMAASLRFTLVVPLLFLGIQVSTAWFFLSSLRNFKPELRRAFLYICAGTILFSLLYSLLAFINYRELYKEGIFKYTGVPGIIPAIGFYLFYLGLRRYALLVGVHIRAVSIRFVLVVYAAIIALLIVGPHPAAIPSGEEAYFDLSLVSDISLAIFAGFGALLARGILQGANTPYVRPLRLLKWYLLLLTVTSVGGTIGLWIAGAFQGASLTLTLVLSGLAPELLLLYTGYAFKKSVSR